MAYFLFRQGKARSGAYRALWGILRGYRQTEKDRFGDSRVRELRTRPVPSKLFILQRRYAGRILRTFPDSPFGA